MPFTLLAHQAPVAPLKLAFPRWFSGTALFIGSMAPDLEYVVRGAMRWESGHTLRGQFTFCLPLTLLLVWLFERVAAPAVAPHLPDAGGFHLRDYAALGDGRHGALGWLRVATSALVGSFSHIFVDGFTHRHGWAVARISLLREPVWHIGAKTIPLYSALQHVGSLLAAVAVIGMLYLAGRRRLVLREREIGTSISAASTPARATRASALVLWGAAAVAGSAGMLARAIAWRLFDHLDDVIVVGWLVLHFVSFAFVGACAAAPVVTRLMDRSHRARRAGRADRVDPVDPGSDLPLCADADS